MAIVILFSFAACSKNSNMKSLKTDDGSFILRNEESVELETPDTALDPEEVYSKLEYTPQMFYGEYLLNGMNGLLDNESETVQDYKANIDYSVSFEDNETNITMLPYAMTAGYKSCDFAIRYSNAHNWMNLHFLTEDGYSFDTLFAYEIDANKLNLTAVKSYEFDKENGKIAYELADDIIEYDFSFKGRELTLSYNGKSVTLSSGHYTDGRDYLYAEDYLSEGSDRIDDIDKISYLWGEDYDDGSRIFFGDKDEKGVYNAVGRMSPDGLFTFTIPYETGNKTYQFVYFLCCDDGIVLTDGENVYYYNDSYSQRNMSSIYKNIDSEQINSLNSLTESELKEIAEKKTDLFSDLANAFNDAGISVQVNKETGEIAMDSTVLFGGDSADLTNEGKEFFNKFVKAYTSIIYNEKYDGFISKTMVEGHIAPVSGTTYEGGLPLSEKRAENVMNYCLSKDTGVDTARLASTMETIGYSQSKPVYDSDGNVDFEASRRVSFRFIINLDK